MSNRNCPNCGAPFDPYKCRCDYCGTLYFDLTIIDVEDKTPRYVSFMTQKGLVTARAVPEMTQVRREQEYISLCEDNRVICEMRPSEYCDIDLTFHIVPDKDGRLYTLNTNERRTSDDRNRRL